MREKMLEELSSSDPTSQALVNDYMQHFIFVLTLEFREDGSCTFSADLSKAKEHLLDAVRSYFRDAFKEQGVDLSDEQIEAYVQLTAQAMVIDLDPIEGQFEEKDGTLVFGDGDPIEYTLSGDTLSFTFDEFGELVFERIG